MMPHVPYTPTMQPRDVVTVEPVIPDDLMALAAIAVSITDRRVVFSDCTEVESLEEAANNLTPETRELIEDWKEKQHA